MQPASLAHSGGARPRVWGVGALVQAVADSLAARFGVVAVRGEISGFSRAPSGHCYFTLKDEAGGASLRCAMFRRAAQQLQALPADGWRVDVTGRLAVYEARGELQLVVDGLQRAGSGSLYEQFLQLKARLEEQGLFDPGRKRAIEPYPVRVGVVTSPSAAALRDVLTALGRRAPHVGVVVYPCLVQGGEAPEQIVRALRQAADRAEVDTLLLCRGGGSLEDLWAFNDEGVVRAVSASVLPVIVGVGHETDFTLADFAADLRAPTPTAAAELAAVARDVARDTLQQQAQQLRLRVRRHLEQAQQQLDHIGLRLAQPAQMVAHQRQRMALLGHRLHAALPPHVQAGRQHAQLLARRLQQGSALSVERERQQLDALGARLRALDPQRVLERGYAWLSDGSGHPLVSAAQVRPGQAIAARLADGVVDATVDQVRMIGGVEQAAGEVAGGA